MTSSGEAVFFWISSIVCVLAALGLVFARKAVYAAMSMAVIMVNLGSIYLAQGADFLGIVQVVVYTGAVMMLFLFVLMMIGVDSADSTVETHKGIRVWGVLLGLGLGALLIAVIGQSRLPAPVGLDEANAGGNVNGLADLIFGPYVWTFELTSALLITAALAAMVLAHRERLIPKTTQRVYAERRFKTGRLPAGKPAPGVYARHNAVDTPALLPDGTPSELSVSAVLEARDQVAQPGQFEDIENAIEREIEEGRTR